MTYLKVIDDHLKTKTFMVGTTLTIADIAIVGSLVSLYRFFMAGYRSKRV